MSSLDEKLVGLMRSVEQRLRSLPGVVGVGVGPKIVAGRTIPVPAIAVFVKKKIALGNLSDDHRIPAEISGVKTDVIECGERAVLHQLDTSHDPDCIGYPRHGDAVKYKAGLISRFAGGPDALEGGIQYGLNRTRFTSNLVSVTRPNRGTIGFFATTTDTDPPKHVFVTCQHGLEWFKGTLTGISVGQPTAQTFWRFLPCCDDEIGVILRVALDNQVDAGAVALNPRTTWKAEIHDGSRQWPPGGPPGQPPGTPPEMLVNVNNAALAGVVTGTHNITTEELMNLAQAGQVYVVQKRGVKTGVTKGRVTHAHFSGFDVHDSELDGDPAQVIRTTSDDLVIVSISPELIWTCHGDSGSAILNTSGELVGLHWGSNSSQPIQGRQAFASRIEHVIAKLNIAPATATAKGVIHTVPDTNLDNVPRASAHSSSGPGSLDAALESMRLSARGRRYLDQMNEHWPEIQRLARTNPRIAAAWRRYRGWEVVTALVGSGVDAEAKIPVEVRRMALDDCLDNLGRVVEPRASPALSADFRRIRTELKGAGGRKWKDFLAEGP